MAVGAGPEGEERPGGGFGTILGVWAHPDDEAYLSAGLMATAVRNGSRVICVTATRGELGSWDEERWPTATLGGVREGELLRSLEILGVTDHRFLGYADGGCADVDQDEAVKRVRDIVEEVRPETVLTFGPDGMTGHADHRAVCAWTTAAFDQAAPAGASLHYATVTPTWAEEWVPKLNRFNVYMEPGTPPITAEEDLSIDFALPEDVLDCKLRAIEQHISQVEGMIAAFGQDVFRGAMRAEWFRPADGSVVPGAPVVGWRP